MEVQLQLVYKASHCILIQIYNFVNCLFRVSKSPIHRFRYHIYIVALALVIHICNFSSYWLLLYLGSKAPGAKSTSGTTIYFVALALDIHFCNTQAFRLTVALFRVKSPSIFKSQTYRFRYHIMVICVTGYILFCKSLFYSSAASGSEDGNLLIARPLRGAGKNKGISKGI